MEDIKWASPVAEGEYRAKSAKMKLPLSGFKKNNNNQKQNNRNKDSKPANNQINEVEENLDMQPNDMEISVTVENPSMVVTEETEILEQNKKTRGNKRGRFNKGKVKELIKQEEVTETSENVLPQNAEIELDIEPKQVEVEEKPAEETKTEEKEVAEPQKKTRRPNRGQGKTRGRKPAKAKKGEDEE